MSLAKFLTWLWLLVILGVLGLWIAEPTAFSQENVARIMRMWGPWAFVGFTLASLVRGALLIPSTPVVLAGGALFPDSLLAVLVVSMVGIAFAGTLLYRFPGFAGYDSHLAAKYPEQLAKLQVHLRKPRATWFVAAWSFFPAVPTDLICYAAGLVGMPYRRMMAGLMLGELPLVTAYVLLGTQATRWLTP